MVENRVLHRGSDSPGVNQTTSPRASGMGANEAKAAGATAAEASDKCSFVRGLFQGAGYSVPGVDSCSIFSTIVLLKPGSVSSGVFDGFLKRKSPGKNGEGTPRSVSG